MAQIGFMVGRMHTQPITIVDIYVANCAHDTELQTFHTWIFLVSQEVEH